MNGNILSEVSISLIKMTPKVKHNHLSTHRSVILHYYNLGHRCAAEIARRTKIPVRTIQYNLAKIRKEGSVEHRRGNGRPRKITVKNSIAIGQWIRRNNEITAEEIVEKLQSTKNLNVSRWTVRRELHRLGYKNALPRGTPMLTNEQKERRVQWALAHKNDDWSRTIFSDETSYQLFRNTIRRWSKYAQEEKKRIPKNKQKIMVWGAFSIKGQISCHSFRTIMDGPLYVEILRKHLLGGAKKQFGSRWRYQQDNDPKHTSRVAKQFLDDKVPETIDWPSNSPDINPIENMWSILKRRVEKRKPSNIDELDQFLHEEWEKVDMTVISNLVYSMKSRCLAIIDSKGERINY
jgi:transposase